MKVIDVSYHNGVIDFNKVKNDGVKGVIIRAGYGKNTMDTQFINNMKGAINAGLHIGIYWFMYGSNDEDAIANAKKCVEIIKGYRDYIDLGVWSDWEYDSDVKATGSITIARRTEFVRLFNTYIESNGFAAGTYTNVDYYKNRFNMKLLTKWPVWIARYNTTLGDYDCLMWQYSSTGKVAGISGNVDLNEYYGTVSEKPANVEPSESESECEQEGYKMPTIRRGSSARAVKVWQAVLGFSGKDVDGIFGPNTEAATRDFQRNHGLVADGIVGPKTWKAGLESVG